MADDLTRFHYTNVLFQSSIPAVSVGGFTVTVNAGLNLNLPKAFVVDGNTKIRLNNQPALPQDISGITLNAPVSAEVSGATGKCVIFWSNPAGEIPWVGVVHYVDDPFLMASSNGSGSNVKVLAGPDNDVPQMFGVGAAATVTIGGVSTAPTDIPTQVHQGDKVTAVLQDGACTSFTVP
jgi:hypothetical protein